MDFLHTHLNSVGKTVHRLGLSESYGLDERGLHEAIESRGLNYLFVPSGAKKLRKVVASLPQMREQLVIAAGPTVGWFGGSVRRTAEEMLREFKTDYLDIFHLFWLGVGSAWTDATTTELRKLKEEGKIRAIGISIHDRVRAGKLAVDSPVDLFMIRYNAAHPGAEHDIFPHLSHRNPDVVAYTATSWRSLLKRPKNWTEAVPNAGDCYRFCLSSPHVKTTLCGPKDIAQLDANLRDLEKGPLSEDEMRWMRAFGKAVHG